MAKKYFVDNQLRAFVIDVGDAEPGIKFFSDDHWPMQVGIMHWPTGHESRPHRHRPCDHNVSITSEALVVWSGETVVLLFDHNGHQVEKIVLRGGSICVMFGGSHGIVVNEESIITELKQGPYDGTQDKVWLDEDDEHSS